MPAGLGLVGRFVLGITADTRQLERDMRRGKNRVDDFERSFRSLTVASNKLLKPITAVTSRVFSLRGAFTTLAGGGLIGAGIKRLSDYGAEVQHMADRLDIGVEQLQRWRLEVEGTGASQTQLNVALTAFSRRRAEALAGNRSYLKVFQQLNIALRDGTGAYRENQEVLDEVIASIRQIPDAGEQFRILQALFSEAGRPLREWIANADEAAAAVAELKVNTEEELRAVTDLNQSFSNTGSVIKTELLSGLALASDRINDFQGRIRDLARDNLPGLVEGAVSLGETTARLAGHWKAVVAIWVGAKFVAFPARLKALDTLIKGLTTSTAAWGTAMKGILIPALAGIGGTLLAGIVLYRNEIKGVIEDLRQAAGALPQAGETVSHFATTSGNAAVQAVYRDLKQAYADLGKAQTALAERRRMGLAEDSAGMRAYIRNVEEAEARVARLVERRRRILTEEREAAQAAGTDTAVAAVAAPAAATVKTFEQLADLDREILEINQKHLELEREADALHAEGLMADLEKFSVSMTNMKVDPEARALVAQLESFASTDNQKVLKDNFDVMKQLEQFASGQTNEMMPADRIVRQQTRMEEVGEALRETFRGIDQQMVSILTNTDSWGDALSRVGRVLLYSGIQSLFTGRIGQALGIVGKATGGMMYAGHPYQLHRDEIVVPHTDATVIPARSAGGGDVTVNVSVQTSGQVDAATADRIGSIAAGKVMTSLGEREYHQQMTRRDG